MKQPMAPKELKRLIALGGKDLKVIDVRSPEEYQAHHLAFSKNIPSSELENEAAKRLKEGDTIVCVCNKGHERSQNAAEKLGQMGYENVFYLAGGILGWPAPER